MKKPKRARREPNAWQRSARWSEIGRASITRWNAKRDSLPKCGAIRKQTGEPCKQLALANGRCYLHGGRTPKGDAWHKPVWPNSDAPNATEKLNRKLDARDAAARRRKRELAKLTPEEREAHERWQRTHKPGSAAERARLRRQRKAAVEMRARSDRPKPPPSAEREALDQRIAELEALREQLDKGVFG